MIGSAAPFFADVAAAPVSGSARWIWTEDGLRLRIGLWTGGQRGTVLLFPGRTEYVEKYARPAAAFCAQGYTLATIDWRGQGLADRLTEDGAVGHVVDFAEYQRDVDSFLAAAEELDLPRPYFLLGHSMGGAIGLRALLRGQEVAAAAFSAPMWGIQLPAALRPVAWGLGWAGRMGPYAGRLAPGGRRQTYISDSGFEGNLLTSDRDMFDYMRRQVVSHPDLALGGPSYGWVYAALHECRALARLPSPRLPALCHLGGAEKIVDPGAIRRRMRRWPQGRLQEIARAAHELMMEAPEIRESFFEAVTAHFDAHGGRRTEAPRSGTAGGHG